MNRNDTGLFFGASVLFACLGLLCLGAYLPYGREKGASLVLQSTYDGNAVDPTFAREATVGAYVFFLMMLLSLAFVVYDLYKQPHDAKIS